MISKVKKDYKAISKEYGHLTRRVWPEMVPWLEKIDKGESLLDVGCGEGRILQSIKPGVNYTGIDFSGELIRLAKTRYEKRKKLKFILADVTKETVWSKLGKYEVIVAGAIIHHLGKKSQQLELLRQMKRHLGKNGKLYLSIWNLWGKKYWKEHIGSVGLKLSCLPESWRWVEIPFREGKAKRFFTALDKKYLEGLMRKAGFENYRFVWGKNKKNLWVIVD